LADSLDVILANLAGHMTEMHVANILLEFRSDLGEVIAANRNIEAFPLSVLLQLSLRLVELVDKPSSPPRHVFCRLSSNLVTHTPNEGSPSRRP
jgi:hypothetical protein